MAIDAVKMLYKPTETTLKKAVEALTTDGELDFVLLGKSGDHQLDAITDEISDSLFASSSIGVFKHLSGEYPTASAFALWVGAKMIQENFIPESIVLRKVNRPVKKLLIYNSYFGTHHSLILLQAC